jgi:hypothetical protein
VDEQIWQRGPEWCSIALNSIRKLPWSRLR